MSGARGLQHNRAVQWLLLDEQTVQGHEVIAMSRRIFINPKYRHSSHWLGRNKHQGNITLVTDQHTTALQMVEDLIICNVAPVMRDTTADLAKRKCENTRV